MVLTHWWQQSPVGFRPSHSTTRIMGVLDNRPFAPKSIADLLAGPKWLIDESISHTAATSLRRLGHDAKAVCGRPEWEGMADPLLLQLARKGNRILVAADKDYGAHVFRDRMPAPPGIVLVRDCRESGQVVRVEDVAGLLMWLMLEQPVAGHFLSVNPKGGRGQKLPADRERLAQLEEIRSHRPQRIHSFAVPERYTKVA